MPAQAVPSFLGARVVEAEQKSNIVRNENILLESINLPVRQARSKRHRWAEESQGIAISKGINERRHRRKSMALSERSARICAVRCEARCGAAGALPELCRSTVRIEQLLLNSL